MNNKLKHINFIDGIRGYAVIYVIFFHAGYSFFSGGFIGVDIFFVLSGFLITLSLQKIKVFDIKALIDFYRRRFFRIVPAALVVLLIAILIGKIILFQEELNDLLGYAKSFFFLSVNIFASNNISYFGINVINKPLIHLWSLSIEMQFYILFPIVFLFVKQIAFNKKILLYQMLVLYVIAFSCLLFIDIDLEARYFSSLLRIWEFLTGSVVALLSIQKNYDTKNNYFIIASLIIFLVAPIYLNASNTTPGITTVLVVVSTAHLLYKLDDNNKLSQPFKLKFISHIGKISYSLYLTHQVVFAYSRILLGRNFSFSESLFLLGIIYFLSLFLYYFVERVFIKYQKKFIYKIIIVLMLLITVFIVFEKYKIELDKNVNAILKYRYDNNPRLKECRVDNAMVNFKNICKYGKNDTNIIALWGDSHIDQIANPLANLISKKFNYSVEEFSIAGCPALIETDLNYKNKRECVRNSNAIFQYIDSNPNIKGVIIYFYYYFYFQKNKLKISEKDVIQKIRYEIESFLKKGKKVFVLYPAPKLLINPPLYLARKIKLFKNLEQTDFEYKAVLWDLEKKKIYQILDKALHNLDVTKIYLDKGFRKDSVYVIGNYTTNVLYYRDDNHLSLSGGRFLAPYIVERLNF